MKATSSRTYDQEIKSLLLYPLRTPPAWGTHDLALRRWSVFRMAILRRQMVGGLPPGEIEPTTNGLTVRRSIAEPERTGLESMSPGARVRVPPFPLNEVAIGGFSRTPLFHGGNTLTGSDGRVIPARGFESHPLRRTDREGFKPSKGSCI